MINNPELEVLSSAQLERPFFDPEANSSLMLPYSLIQQVLQQAIRFNNDTRPEKGQYLLGEFHDFAETMQHIPGYLGVFGTGYPFYAFRPDGSVLPVPEISRFLEETTEKVSQDKERLAGRWACTACQVQNDLPDLKTICRPCDMVGLKPRQVFKALPDLDFWVIVAQDGPSIEEIIEKQAHQAGFYQSDSSIYRAVRDTGRVLKALAEGTKPDTRLPIDMHVITGQEFSELLRRVDNITQDTNDPKVLVSPRTLHVNWEHVDTPYNFTKDFVWSLTEKGLEESLSVALQATRRTMAEKLHNGQIARLAIESEDIPKRQLADPTMLGIFAKRINEWRER
ncbi:MAG TPA: hypothetical protein VNE40_04845 [Candidatus Dormibacteraeota bacterium]|nr:hypothetical protein [Candidatus Dormibacteraeota bacterium]